MYKRQISNISGPITESQLGFTLGPRINAGGRIGNASLGARLLTSTNRSEAEMIACELEGLNKERQALEAEMLLEAESQVIGHTEKCSVIVVSSKAWHPGIVGLISARLKELWQRPAFAIAFNSDGVGSGSGRSIPGVDLGKAIDLAISAGLLVKGGGHALSLIHI